MLNVLVPANVEMHLYSNNLTPSESDVVGTFIECSSGYTAATLIGSSWTVTTAAGITTAQYADRTFSFSTSATVYGYYLTTTSKGQVILSEIFTGAPVLLSSGGGTIVVTPRVSLD